MTRHSMTPSTIPPGLPPAPGATLRFLRTAALLCGGLALLGTLLG